MRTYYIYKATNKINGKSYVGQTCAFHSRVWQHQRCYEKEDCDFILWVGQKRLFKRKQLEEFIAKAYSI